MNENKFVWKGDERKERKKGVKLCGSLAERKEKKKGVKLCGSLAGLRGRS
jgi:hypothetical protein